MLVWQSIPVKNSIDHPSFNNFFSIFFIFSPSLSFSLSSILYLLIVLIIIKSVLGSRRVKKNRSTSFSLPITIDIYCSSLFPFFYLVPRLLLTLKSLFTYTLKIITRPSFFLSFFLPVVLSFFKYLFPRFLIRYSFLSLRRSVDRQWLWHLRWSLSRTDGGKGIITWLMFNYR